MLASGSLVWADDFSLTQAQRGWVDSATARKTATLLHVDFPVDRRAACGEAAEYEQQGLVVWTEFFNNRIDQVVHFGGPIGATRSTSPELHLARRGLLLTADGRGPDRITSSSTRARRSPA